MPKISVIVPVYKVEKYLDRCVESVLNQTFSDFELILVDDGSPDNCPALCDQWAEKDSRIRVIHKENGGLSDARNAGLDVVSGDWITFVDSDDYIHPQMLQLLFEAAEKHGVTVSACGYQETSGDPLDLSSVLPAEVHSVPEFFEKRCVDATVAWAKLYKASFFDSVRYPLQKLHEDEFVTYRILFSCRKIAFIDSGLYGYFQNNSGIMKSRWNIRRLDMLTALEEQLAFFKAQSLDGLFRWRGRWYLCYVLHFAACIDQCDTPNAFKQDRRRILSRGRRFLKAHPEVLEKGTDDWIRAKLFPLRFQAKLYLDALGKKLLRRK